MTTEANTRDGARDGVVISEALRAFKLISADACGALVRERADGTMVGAMLVEGGRVCWAVCNAWPRRLTDLLVAESEALTVKQVNALVAECLRERVPLGETLLARGLVTLPVLHRALLRHTCESLDHLLRNDSTPWSWVAHAKASYDPLLTFSRLEILVGLAALAAPSVAIQAQARLQQVLTPRLQGIVFHRTRWGRTPIAQVGCEAMDLATVSDLSAHADGIMTVAATAELKVAVVEFREIAFASWAEDTLRFVLLRDGELAFNRLLAHIAATSTIL